MTSDSLPSRKTTTTFHFNKKDAPFKLHGTKPRWSLSKGDIVLIVPAKGPYIYLTCTSLSAVTRIIVKIGGPLNLPAISTTLCRETNIKTYNLTLERKFLSSESRILSNPRGNRRHCSQWTNEEWINYLKQVGRNRGSYSRFIQVKYKKLKNTAKCKELYWQMLEEAGLKKSRAKQASA